MAYRTAPQMKFAGGLNLREGADVVRSDECVDAMNVVFLPAGGVGQRAGTQHFTTDPLTNQPDSLGVHMESDGTRQLLVGNGNRIDVLSTAGVSIANVATTAGPHSFVRFAAPGSEHTLLANGTDTVRRWDGAAFSTPAYTGTTPTGKFLAVQSRDNRLVVARTIANPERVLFSDPGLPTTFGANNYEDLHPGSGEPITALVAYNDAVFAFKESEFFVFYATSTDATGEPVFDYRHVAGAGSLGAACAAPEGVYFLGARGVYRTTGGAPELVSGALDPIFLDNASLFYTGGVASPSHLADARLWWCQGRLYLAFATSSTNNRLAVFSPRDGWWTLFDLGVAAMTSFSPASREELVFAYAAGANHIGRYTEGSALLADDILADGTGGTAIASHWHQGWVDYGSQDSKTIRQTKVWGSGAAEFAIARDYGLTAGASTRITLSESTILKWDEPGLRWDDGSQWGPASSTNVVLVRRAVRGTVFSLRIGNDRLNTSWSLHRLEQQFREFSRGPEVVSLERSSA